MAESRPIFGQSDVLPGLRVSRETSDRLHAFAELLLLWNRSVNLIGKSSEGDLWRRHILDSVQLARLMQREAGAIDIGSGAGFPGLVLAIVTGTYFHLVEADQRKVAFLREAIRITNARAIVHDIRAEHLSLPPAPLVTARAVAPLPRLLRIAVPMLAPGGVCLLLKGANAERELTEAQREWHMHVERFPSRTAGDATILRLSEIQGAGVRARV